MRTVYLALAVFVALTAFAAATVDFDEDSSYGFDLEESSSGSSASATSASSGGSTEAKLDAMRKLKAPKSVPKMEMRDFGDETMRIKRKLERRRELLLKDTTDLKTELKELEKQEAVLMKRIHKIRQHARDAKREAIKRAKGEVSKEEKALQKAIDEHNKGLDFVRELKHRVSVLHDAADRASKAKSPAAKNDAKDKYDEARAWVKQSLESGTANFPELYMETGVVSALQEIQDGYEAGVQSDVEESDMRLYESGKLKGLVKRMMEALRKKLALAKKALKDHINRPAIPEHLRAGLAEAEKELAALRKKAYGIQDKIDDMEAANRPALEKIDRELAKIKGIEGQVYEGDELGSSGSSSSGSSSASSGSSSEAEDEEDVEESESADAEEESTPAEEDVEESEEAEESTPAEEDAEESEDAEEEE